MDKDDKEIYKGIMIIGALAVTVIAGLWGYYNTNGSSDGRRKIQLARESV